LCCVISPLLSVGVGDHASVTLLLLLSTDRQKDTDKNIAPKKSLMQPAPAAQLLSFPQEFSNRKYNLRDERRDDGSSQNK
jgi:hypothetical protein